MEFEYKLTLEDYTAMAYIVDSFSKKRIIANKFLAVLFIVDGIILCLLTLPRKQYLSASLYISILLIIYSIYIYASKPAIAKKLTNFKHSKGLKRNPHLLDIQKIRIETDEFFHTNNGVLTKIKADKISKFVVRDNLIVAFIDKNNICFAIPFSAFDSNSQRDIFIDKINELSKGRLIY